MKECVYGWYPAAREVRFNNPHSQPPKDSYEAECMYRHYNSRFNDQPGVDAASPLQPSPVWETLEGEETASPAKSVAIRVPSVTAVRVQSRAESRAHTRPPARADYRPESSKRAVITPTPPPGPKPVIRAKKAWSMALAETEMSNVAYPPSDERTTVHSKAHHEQQYHRVATPIQYTSRDSHGQTRTEQVQNLAEKLEARAKQLQSSLDRPQSRPGRPQSRPVPPSRAEVGAGSREARVKSATTHRPKYSAPERSVRSALARSGSSYGSITHRPVPVRPSSAVPATKLVSTSVPVATRPSTAVPFARKPDSPELDRNVDYQPVLDYDKELKRHGWRMEVHGDPLDLKRWCLPKRPSFVSTVAPSVVRPNAPKAHMESNEPYFYNTIPRKPMTFTIHPEWLSEILGAKRQEAQKKHGYVYRTKEFAFIY